MRINRLVRILTILVTGILFPCVLVAQVNDAGIWTSINIEKRFTEKLSIVLSEEFRLNENITELGTHYTELGPEYRITKNLTAGLAYRFIQKRRVDDSYSFRHRVLANLSYRIRYERFSFTLRERYQVQYKDVESSPGGSVPQLTLRSKFTLKYRIKKKLDAFASMEVFHPLNNPEIRGMEQWRSATGLEYALSKKSAAEIFYMINKEVNVNDPWTEYVIGLSYGFRF